MIPFIRSHSELKALTESRDQIKIQSKIREGSSSRHKNNQMRNIIKSTNNKEILLPNLPKPTKSNLIKSKEAVLKFFDDLDYNNQIQSSYEITLIERQSNMESQDVA